MITYKTEKEIEIMKRAGRMLHIVLQEAPKYVTRGARTSSINTHIENKILELGGEPEFKRVKGYRWATCICINEQAVHTPPSERVVEDGDVVTIDAGVFLEGFHTDSAITIQIGTQDPQIEHFLETGKRALNRAIKQAIVGKRIGHISRAFQKTIESGGYAIISELTGHGIGKDLHEDPYVPCFSGRPIGKTMELKKGMTLALEVMYAMGDSKIKYEKDGWSICTADKSVTACFEHSVVIEENKPFILT